MSNDRVLDDAATRGLNTASRRALLSRSVRFAGGGLLALGLMAGAGPARVAAQDDGLGAGGRTGGGDAAGGIGGGGRTDGPWVTAMPATGGGSSGASSSPTGVAVTLLAAGAAAGLGLRSAIAPSDG